MASENRVAELNWQAVGARIDGGAVALLPVGAGAKEHGLHLPMATDLIQAEWLAVELARRVDALVWPALAYGHYPAFTDYPGSISLSAETFRTLAREIMAGILAHGPGSLLVINTGISTIAPLERAIADLATDRVRLANVYSGTHYLAAVREIGEQPCGGHADELETSILLAITPEKVRMPLARPCLNPGLEHGRFIRSDPGHAQYSPDGVYGDPTRASREKGEILLRAILEDLLAGHQ